MPEGMIVNNALITNNAHVEYEGVFEEETGAYKELESINNKLAFSWYGEAGDAFADMALSVETNMKDSMQFSNNSSMATEDVADNFVKLDGDRKDSLEIKEQIV